MVENGFPMRKLRDIWGKGASWRHSRYADTGSEEQPIGKRPHKPLRSTSGHGALSADRALSESDTMAHLATKPIFLVLAVAGGVFLGRLASTLITDYFGVHGSPAGGRVVASGKTGTAPGSTVGEGIEAEPTRFQTSTLASSSAVVEQEVSIERIADGELSRLDGDNRELIAEVVTLEAEAVALRRELLALELRFAAEATRGKGRSRQTRVQQGR